MTLTCATASKGQVTYKFLLNNRELQTGLNNKYTVPSKAMANSNSYTCKVIISGAESVASGEHKILIVGEFIVAPQRLY